MIKVEVPNYKTIELEYAVFDYNGTIAADGVIDDGVAERLELLSKKLKLFIVTLDTFGTVKKQCEHLPVEVKVVPKETGGLGKKVFVNELGKSKTVCIGNGNNDVDMFSVAELSLIILGKEGMAVQSLKEADVVFQNSLDAIDFLLSEKRMIATLRK